MTSFVGHGEELARLVAELPARPMVTLTGVGGVGKTRLATEAARAAAGEFPDGVWLCELAPVADPDAVAHAVATTLAVRRQEGLSMLDSVVDALRGRRLLLILDNCEHVLDAAAELARRVTASCPTVALLATSREPVGVAAERVWAVPSLGRRGGGRGAVLRSGRRGRRRLLADGGGPGGHRRDLRAARRDTPRHRTGRRPGPFHDPQRAGRPAR